MHTQSDSRPHHFEFEAHPRERQTACAIRCSGEMDEYICDSVFDAWLDMIFDPVLVLHL